MDHHPSPEELEGLVFGRISAERTRTVVAHLLRGCGECRGALAPYVEALKGDVQSLPILKEEVYDGALDRALASVRGLAVARPPVQVRAVTIFDGWEAQSDHDQRWTGGGVHQIA